MNGRQPRRQDFFFIIRADARCGRRSRRSWIFCARNATAHSGVPKSYSPRHLLAKIRHYVPLDWRLIVAVHFVAYWHQATDCRASPIRSLSEAQRTCRERVGRGDPALLTHLGHWLCTAAMVLMPGLRPYQSTRLNRYNAGPG